MTLTIDLGNTRAKLTIFDAEAHIVEHQSVAHPDLVAAAQSLLQAHPEVHRICWCAVGEIPSALPNFFATCGLEVQQLRPTAPPSGIIVDYRTPETLGADRLAAVMGAQSLLPHRTLLVIDAGTCITFDLLLANGHYVGGNISPGLDMRLRAMHKFTARLPLVSAQSEAPAFGFDTRSALCSGAKQGIRLEILGYLAQVREQHPDACAFLTGGNRFDFDIPLENCNFAAESAAIATDSCIFADEYLVARGLYALPSSPRCSHASSSASDG